MGNLRHRFWLGLLAASLVALTAATAEARPLCTPCAGLTVTDPAAVGASLAGGPELPEQAVLFVKWEAAPGADVATAAGAVRAAGATPWVAFSFATTPPLLENLAALEGELRELARIAEEAGEGAWIQLLWPGAGATPAPSEYAFLIKRAAVVVSGAAPEAQVATAPLPPDGDSLARLYGEEVAAYLDAVALAPADSAAIASIAAALRELDPDASLVVDSESWPSEPLEVLAGAARNREAGAEVTLFATDRSDLEAVQPFLLLAREFQGDLSPDPYSAPQGAAGAWSFVRGSDLGLRVVVRTPVGAERLDLRFPDPQLRDPGRIDPATGERLSLYGLRTSTGYELTLDEPPPVVLLAFDRMSAAELEGMLGVEERVTVQDIRQIPVGEILRRLQAFEDAQARSLSHYQAVNTTHLRFQVGTGAQAVEATFQGDFFFRQKQGFDWAWKEFFFNGVKWRHDRIPEIPLIQPEKATALPAEITFTKEYRYSLRGIATVDGRECWVVDFEPAVQVQPGRSLYQGTVWVDREIYARVQSRAVQLGLEGDVISNEETQHYTPVDAAGQPAAWSPDSYFLPLRVTGQQIWSVLNATTVVEREIQLTDLAVNAPDFDARRQAVLDSEATMVRDTAQGMRYLVVDEETGERVVQEKLDTSRRFLLGGVFYDESLDYPVPLAGMNWLWFDLKERGIQANVFFAGALFDVAVTDPSFLGSKWDAGINAFGLAIPGTDTVFRGDDEIREENVKYLRPHVGVKLGRPIGSFTKVELGYEISYLHYSDTRDTADDFVIPSDHLAHAFSLTGRYNRAGYRFRLEGSYHLRGEWDAWGFAANPDYSADRDQYTKWNVGLGKTWHLPHFLKFGAEVEYVGGTDLDRFSKYDFGFFSSVRVHGYQSDKVRAEEAYGAHLSYGFDLGSVIRLDLVGDAVWATDEAAGLERELLAGVGLTGTVVGPWQTLINVDLGTPVAGPDDGFGVLLTVLRLFR
jgi:hypothetical protein